MGTISVSGVVVSLCVNHFIKSPQLSNEVGTLPRFSNERMRVYCLRLDATPRKPALVLVPHPQPLPSLGQLPSSAHPPPQPRLGAPQLCIVSSLGQVPFICAPLAQPRPGAPCVYHHHSTKVSSLTVFHSKPDVNFFFF